MMWMKYEIFDLTKDGAGEVIDATLVRALWLSPFEVEERRALEMQRGRSLAATSEHPKFQRERPEV